MTLMWSGRIDELPLARAWTVCIATKISVATPQHGLDSARGVLPVRDCAATSMMVGASTMPLVRVLPATSTSLAAGAPSQSAPGTIFVLGPYGGVVVEANSEARVSFGRNLPEVDVGIGVEDDRISRQHGYLSYLGGRWQLCNLGRVPLRLPGSVMVFAETEPVELPEGYTPIFLHSPSGREHLLEVRIAPGLASAAAAARPAALTNTAPSWSRNGLGAHVCLVGVGRANLRACGGVPSGSSVTSATGRS
jgi:hypothetical protein